MTEITKLTTMERAVLNNVVAIYDRYVNHHDRHNNSLLLYGLVDFHNHMCRLWKEDPDFVASAIKHNNTRDLVKALRPYYMDWLRNSSHGSKEAAEDAELLAPNFIAYISRLKKPYPLFAEYDEVRYFFALRMARKENENVAA